MFGSLGAIAMFACRIGGQPSTAGSRSSAVGRLEDAHPGVAESLALDEALLLRPERRVEHVGIARVEQHFVRAGVVVLEQHLLEVRPPSVERNTPRSALGPYG
jgi:hypothetical protein